MKKIINIKDIENAIKEVTVYKNKRFGNTDVRFINVYIKIIFTKNSFTYFFI